MCILKIKCWYGRNGNNLIQIINVIRFALDKGFDIDIPSHKLFEVNFKNDNLKCKCKKIIYDTKKTNFYHKYYNGTYALMRSITYNYIKLKNINVSKHQNQNISIHIRGGDIFIKPHKLYVQPPLDYYNKIIDANMHKNISICYGSNNNIVIDKLKNKYINFKNIIFQSSTITNDIQTLIESQTLVSSFSSFVLIPILFSNTIKKIIVPQNMDYFIDLKNDIFKIIKFPNYIDVWTNSAKERNMMLTYTIKQDIM